MHQVTIALSDEAYDSVEKRARQEGFQNLETFLSDFVVTRFQLEMSMQSDAASVDGADDFDHFFTPAIIREIDAAAEEARTGNNVGFDEVRRRLERKRQAWQENHRA